jgi:asparagine synthase (glutamine-hydrolysing)
MCGFAGVYQLNCRQVPVGLVESIGTFLKHRGPDKSGFLAYENFAVSHNRLSLLDFSAAADQPFRNNDYVLAFSGEIYNYREIRDRLRRDYGVEFSTTSDTEVLFNLLIYEGIEAALKQIKGMFAFSFYDKTKDELWLARDRLGIKPLYYFQKDGGFYWSSEIKALVKTFDIKPDPIKTLFSINGIGEKSTEYTLFNGVKPVKPGSYIKVTHNAGEPEVFTYYQPIDDFEPEIYKELDRLTTAEVLDRFESLLESSVESMLASDAPLGAFVSGGVDSSLISAIASRKYTDFSLFTADIVGKHSEFKDAQNLARHLGTPLFDFKFEPAMLLADWAEVTYFYENPIVVHTNAIPFSKVAEMTRSRGVKAVLTGEGADELFLGYPRLLSERYKRLAAFPVSAIKSLYKIVPGLAEYLFPNTQPTTMDFLKQLVRSFDETQFAAAGSDKFNFLPEGKRVEQFLTIKMLGEHLTTLLYRNDRMGMMSSIEARFPFLDENMVKFAVNLPVKYKIVNSFRLHNYKHPFLVDKWILRKTAEKYLPKKSAFKKKEGFPMLGYKNLRVKNGFFKNGWVSENLQMSRRAQTVLTETQNPYFIAKLAAIEVFGKIYGGGETLGNVKSHVLKYAEMFK